MHSHWNRTAITIALVVCSLALLVSVASQPINAESTHCVQETLTMAATWGAMTQTTTPPAPSVTFAPTSTPPTQPTVIVDEPIIMAYVVYLPEVKR